MAEYVYSKPQRKHKKEIAVFVVVAVIALIIIFQYEQIISLVTGYPTRAKCSEDISQICHECFITSRYALEHSEYFENQTAVGSNVIDCSNLYFDSNWTGGQDCSKYYDFCYTFLSE